MRIVFAHWKNKEHYSLQNGLRRCMEQWQEGSTPASAHMLMMLKPAVEMKPCVSSASVLLSAGHWLRLTACSWVRTLLKVRQDYNGHFSLRAARIELKLQTRHCMVLTASFSSGLAWCPDIYGFGISDEGHWLEPLRPSLTAWTSLQQYVKYIFWLDTSLRLKGSFW